MTNTGKLQAVPDLTQERRRQILRAAMTCFGRRGFHPTTVNDISAEAEISVGLIYRYFDSKDAIIKVIASEHLEDLREILKQARAAPTLFQALKIIAVCHCEEQPEHVHAAFVADLYAEAARNEEVRLLVRDVIQFFTDSIADLIAGSDEAQAAADGLTPRVAAEIIVDSLRGMMMRAIVDSSTLTASQIRERQLAMLRTLWPLLFARSAPAERVEQVQS